MDKSAAVLKVKGMYASGARGAGTLLTKAHVLSDQPPARDRRTKHWVYSLTRAYDSLAIAELDVPWWTYRAIDVVESWLSAHPHPIRVFEYGSGASTLWLSKRADEIHSVEHHAEFGEFIAKSFADAGGRGNISFRIVPPVKSEHPAIGSHKEGNAGLDFSDYVHAIDDVPGQFSLIVIDGRARQACLVQAAPRLEPGGIIVFDNTRRKRYRDAIAASGLTERRLGGLTPTLPYPDMTSILTAAH